MKTGIKKVGQSEGGKGGPTLCYLSHELFHGAHLQVFCVLTSPLGGILGHVPSWGSSHRVRGGGRGCHGRELFNFSRDLDDGGL